MIAPTRPEAATGNRTIWWQQAAAVRDYWLGQGLVSAPADRAGAERAITAIYARVGRPRPKFTWVDSPRAAIGLRPGGTSLDDLYRWVIDPPAGHPPLASDLAAHRSQLRGALEAAITVADRDSRPPKRDKPKDPWPELPADAALRAGQPFHEIVRRGVRRALTTSLGKGFCLPVRAALGPVQTQPICWYGQQDVDWIAYFDVWRRLGMATFRLADTKALDDWSELARSCGWWWPAEDTCMIAERPDLIKTRPVPGANNGEQQGVSVTYRDGWRVVM